MVESAVVLSVFGMFGFCVGIACLTRVSRLEKRLEQLERERGTMR